MIGQKRNFSCLFQTFLADDAPADAKSRIKLRDGENHSLTSDLMILIIKNGIALSQVNILKNRSRRLIARTRVAQQILRPVTVVARSSAGPASSYVSGAQQAQQCCMMFRVRRRLEDMPEERYLEEVNERGFKLESAGKYELVKRIETSVMLDMPLLEAA